MLEFYASTEGEAILVNLSGEKPGCKGRPLPGSAEVRLAAYDVESNRLRERPDGFAVASGPGEVGMLLTRLRGVVSTSESPLRGLFEPNDAWLSTGDLFRADDDGDLWLVDRAQSLIRTAHGFVASFPIVDALGDLDAIDLAVVYGVPAEGAEASLAIAAVTLLDGAELDGEDLAAALSVCSPTSARSGHGRRRHPRSPPGTGRAPPRSATPGCPRAPASGAARRATSRADRRGFGASSS